MTAPINPRVDLLLSSGRHDITADVLQRHPLTITRGRQAEGSQAGPTRVDAEIKNLAGKYSPRNPLSPLYGLIGRNTQAQVYLGAPHVGAGGGSGTPSTSHVAPSVTAATDGLLICGWASVDVVTYTVPGAMTDGSGETGVDLTMATAYQVVAAGATGTRTATASGSKGYAAVSAVAHGSSVAVEEVLTHTPTGEFGVLETVTLTTDAGTQVGWWLVAVQGWLLDMDMPMPDSPYGDHGGWILLGDSGVVEATNAFDFTVYLRQRIWVRRVNHFGAQQVILAGHPDVATAFAGNIAALYVVSGIDDWDIRATVEIPSWPSRWDVSGTHVWVPVEGAGILRRLQQGSAPLLSPLRRALTGSGVTVWTGKSVIPAAYWHMEDATGSGQAASGLPGGQPLVATDTIQWGSVSVTGSASLPDWSAGPGHLVGPAVGVTTDAGWGMGCLVQYTGATSWDAVRLTVQGGPYGELRLILGASSVVVQGVTSSGVTTVLSDTTDLSDGEPHWVEIRAGDKDVFGAGTMVFWLHLDGVQVVSSGTVSGAPGVPLSVRAQRRGADTAALGHLGIWADPPLELYYLLEPAIRAHAGETAGRRMERLCHEQGIPLHIVGDPDDAVEMGEQPIATLLSLLRECEEADLGILYEPREMLGLACRTRTSRYNQPVTLSLTYGAEGEVAPPLEPQDDDRYTRNDATVSRSGGSSYRYEVTSGPLSVQDPPDGVGRYDTAVTINVSSDAHLPDQASARAHLGTVDELRYPTVRVNLRRLDELGKQSYSRDAAALDLGDRLQIEAPPPWLPPDAIDQHVEGGVETLGSYVRDLALVCVPAGPYTVGVVEDDVLGRADTDGMELASDFAAGTDTSMSVTVTAGPAPILTSTHAAMFSFDIRCGGVVLTVTGISGSGPYTFTVLQDPVNGVIKTIPAGTALSLADPWKAAL